jgi:hypothetical protein
MGYFLIDSSGRQIPIGLMMRIGCDPANQIVLQDSQASAFHAILGDQPDGLLIRDENSASGTFVNARQINAVTKLRAGDRIRLGGDEFSVGSTEPVPSISPVEQPTVEPVQPEIPALDEAQLILEPEPVNTPIVPVTVQPEPPVVPPAPETVRMQPPLAAVPPTQPPPVTQAAPVSMPIAPASLPPVKEKKSGGCFKWTLTIFLVLILACVVLGGGGYLLLRAGIIPQRMIDNVVGMGTAQIAIYNFSDQTAYIRIQQKFEDENTVTMPHIYWDLAPNDSKTDMRYTGTNEKEIMTIGTTKDGDELGSCIFVPRQTDDYYIVILPDKVLIDNILYPKSTDKPPVSGNDLILATSSLCE